MANNNIPSDAILSLNQAALQAKNEGRDVINGTIGMMFLDDGSLPVSETMKKLLSVHTKDDDFSYPSVGGPKAYLDSAIRWFFGDSLIGREEEGKLKSIGTMGGTGAVSSSVRISTIGKKSLVLIPSYCWPNYPCICENYLLEHRSYDLFASDGSFGLASIVSHIKKAHKDGFENVTIIINDPCHNPTGYSMNEEEWDNLVEALNSASSYISISLIIDCAYIDFAPLENRGFILNAVKKLNDKIVAYLAMSFSKTFSFYGLRIGLLGITSSSKKLVDEQHKKALIAARATWSVPNHMAMNTIAEALGDESTFVGLKEGVNADKNILANRASIFLKEAEESKLSLLPYRNGFFVTIKCPDAIKTSKTLQNKDIFLGPVASDCLRVALSSILTPQVSGLASAIKVAL